MFHNLQNSSILLITSRNPSIAEFRAELAYTAYKFQAAIVSHPTILIEDLDKLKEIILKIDQINTIILTSRKSAQILFCLLYLRLKNDKAAKGFKGNLCVVGDKLLKYTMKFTTSNCLKDFFTVDSFICPKTNYSAAELALELANKNIDLGNTLHVSPFKNELEASSLELYLAENSTNYKKVMCYKQSTSELGLKAGIANFIDDGGWVAFTSGGGVKIFLNGISIEDRKILHAKKIAAIGSSTAMELKKNGFKVAVTTLKPGYSILALNIIKFDKDINRLQQMQ